MRPQVTVGSSGASTLLAIFFISSYSLLTIRPLEPLSAPHSVVTTTQVELDEAHTHEITSSLSPGVLGEQRQRQVNPMSVTRAPEKALVESKSLLRATSEPYYPQGVLRNCYVPVIFKPAEPTVSLPPGPISFHQRWPTIATPVVYPHQRSFTPPLGYHSFLTVQLPPVGERYPTHPAGESAPAAKVKETSIQQADKSFSLPKYDGLHAKIISDGTDFAPARTVAGGSQEFSPSEDIEASDVSILLCKIFKTVPKDVMVQVSPLLFPFKYDLENKKDRIHRSLGALELAKRFYYLENFQGYPDMRARDAIQQAIECGTLMRNSICSTESMDLHLKEIEHRSLPYNTLRVSVSAEKLFYASILLAAAADRLYHDFVLYQRLIQVMKDRHEVLESQLEADLQKIDQISEFAKTKRPHFEQWFENQRRALRAISWLFFQNGEAEKILRVGELLSELVVMGPMTNDARHEVLNLVRQALGRTLSLYLRLDKGSKASIKFLERTFCSQPGISHQLKIWKMDVRQLRRIMELYRPPTCEYDFKKDFLMTSSCAGSVMKNISEDICHYAGTLVNDNAGREIENLQKIYKFDYSHLYEGDLVGVRFKNVHSRVSTWIENGRTEPQRSEFEIKEKKDISRVDVLI